MSWGTVNSDTPFEAPTPLLVTGRNSSVDGKEEDSSSFLAEKTRKAQKEKRRRRKRRKWLDKRISPPSRKTSQFMQKGENIGNKKTKRQVRKMLNYYTSHIHPQKWESFLFFVFKIKIWSFTPYWRKREFLLRDSQLLTCLAQNLTLLE